MALSQCQMCINLSACGCTVNPSYHKAYTILSGDLEESSSTFVVDLIEPCEDWDEAVELDLRISLKAMECLCDIKLTASQTILLEPLLEIANKLTETSRLHVLAANGQQLGVYPIQEQETVEADTFHTNGHVPTLARKESSPEEVEETEAACTESNLDVDTFETELSQLLEDEKHEVTLSGDNNKTPKGLTGESTADEKSKSGQESEVNTEDSPTQTIYLRTSDTDLEIEPSASSPSLKPQSKEIARSSQPANQQTSSTGELDSFWVTKRPQSSSNSSRDHNSGQQAKRLNDSNRGSGRSKSGLTEPGVFFTL
ncbi:hypothetical protein [Halomicronema sp. CCY15110]|uniref:hypothetical protein n=1 Tax=Halomicronema sp. CCY15110 TaxID=2767773 RepID=UPI00194DCE8C|nr:hypothetical protein [Halomicronema sp. CCY15110]